MKRQVLVLARALALVLRRQTDVPPDGVAIHYSRTIRPMFWVMLAVNPVDIVMVEVVVKSAPVRIALLVLEILGALWFLALVATLYKYPHSVGRDGLRVRYLSFFDQRIPLASIDSVRQTSRSLKARGSVSVPEDGVLAVGISQATNLSIALREPRLVDLGRKGTVEITQLDLWADDPRAAVAAIRDQLPASV